METVQRAPATPMTQNGEDPVKDPDEGGGESSQSLPVDPLLIDGTSLDSLVSLSDAAVEEGLGISSTGGSASVRGGFGPDEGDADEDGGDSPQSLSPDPLVAEETSPDSLVSLSGAVAEEGHGISSTGGSASVPGGFGLDEGDPGDDNVDSFFEDDPLDPAPEKGGGNFVFLVEDDINDATGGAALPATGDAEDHNVISLPDGAPPASLESTTPSEAGEETGILPPTFTSSSGSASDSTVDTVDSVDTSNGTFLNPLKKRPGLPGLAGIAALALIAAIIAVIVLLLGGDESQSPAAALVSPTPTYTTTFTRTPTSTPTPPIPATATQAGGLVFATSAALPGAASTPTPTALPGATSTPTATPTATPTGTLTVGADRPASGATSTPTTTATPTTTPTPTPTATLTPTPTQAPVAACPPAVFGAEANGVVPVIINNGCLAPLFFAFLPGADPLWQLHTQQTDIHLSLELYTVFGPSWTGQTGSFPLNCGQPWGLCLVFDADGVGPIPVAMWAAGQITINQLDAGGYSVTFGGVFPSVGGVVYSLNPVTWIGP